MESTAKKMVRLRSSDGEEFEVPEETISAASGTVRAMLEEGRAAGVVPLPNVTAAILSRVVEYVNRHFDADSGFVPDYLDQPLGGFGAELLKVGSDTLVGIVQAADYLNMESLVQLGCRALAEQIRGKTVEQIREILHIVNDYTEEEEEEVRRENAWAFG
ncbi:hypothetical protein ACP70R_037775 [Stipagrostis hirtigluma subsp. patula]